MKKLVFTLSIVLCSVFMFSFINSTKNVFPESVAKEWVKLFEKEHIKTINNEFLITQLEGNFKSLFDDITLVHAQKQIAGSKSYYYIVFGTKNGVEKVDFLKVDKSDVENERYTYLTIPNAKTSAVVQYCRTGLVNPSVPGVCVGTSCGERPDGCLGFVCGVWNGSFCVKNQF